MSKTGSQDVNLGSHEDVEAPRLSTMLGRFPQIAGSGNTEPASCTVEGPIKLIKKI